MAEPFWATFSAGRLWRLSTGDRVLCQRSLLDSWNLDTYSSQRKLYRVVYTPSIPCLAGLVKGFLTSPVVLVPPNRKDSLCSYLSPAASRSNSQVSVPCLGRTRPAGSGSPARMCAKAGALLAPLTASLSGSTTKSGFDVLLFKSPNELSGLVDIL